MKREHLHPNNEIDIFYRKNQLFFNHKAELDLEIKVQRLSEKQIKSEIAVLFHRLDDTVDFLTNEVAQRMVEVQDLNAERRRIALKKLSIKRRMTRVSWHASWASKKASAEN